MLSERCYPRSIKRRPRRNQALNRHWGASPPFEQLFRKLKGCVRVCVRIYFRCNIAQLYSNSYRRSPVYPIHRFRGPLHRARYSAVLGNGDLCEKGTPVPELRAQQLVSFARTMQAEKKTQWQREKIWNYRHSPAPIRSANASLNRTPLASTASTEACWSTLRARP
jgi:hypothetical protein